MRVQVTLDYYDGSRSKITEVDLADGASARDLVFLMMQGGVCGCSLTKCKAITKVLNDEQRTER